MPNSVNFGTQISADSDLRVGGCLALLSADPRPQLPVQRLLQQLRRRRRRRRPNRDVPKTGNSRMADGSERKKEGKVWKSLVKYRVVL